MLHRFRFGCFALLLVRRFVRPRTPSSSARRGLALSAAAYALSAIAHSTAHAEPPARSNTNPNPSPGISFSKDDWELRCDNTGTCRAAGYHADDSASTTRNPDTPPLAVSVLLTRRAGPGTPVSAQLQLGSADDEHLPPLTAFKVNMQVNGRPQGEVAFAKGKFIAALSPAQTAAVLAVLPKKAEIAWTQGENRWALSDAGATAVLLKMDDVQGRVGTPGALVKKGSKPESAVPAAQAMPKVALAPLAPKRPGDDKLAASPALRRALLATANDDTCDKLHEEKPPVEFVQRLDDTHILVSAACWGAAYNYGSAYWIVNDKPPYKPALVTTDGSGYKNGVIQEVMKGRGIADCLSINESGWDGKTFAPLYSGDTGTCRLVALGGTWRLPTFEAEANRNGKRVATGNLE